MAPPPPPPPRKRRITARRAVAFVVVLLAVAGAFVLGSSLIGSDDAPTQAAVKPLPVVKGRPAETRINEIYAKVSAGVVSVQVSDSGQGASGTGFVLDADGTIVTNSHVVQGAQRALGALR